MPADKDPKPAPTQHWDPARYQRNAGFVPVLGAPVLELLAPQPGERILDLGCGDGALTERLVAAGAKVVGVDSSAEQIAAARARGLDARVMSGEALTFAGGFEAVFSNAALHWMAGGCRHRRRLAGARAGRALRRRDGRRCQRRRDHGGAGGGPRPARARWACGRAVVLPGPEDYRARLERRGFKVRTIGLIERPTPLPGAMAGWLETFAESFIRRLPEQDRAAYIAEVEAALAPKLRDAQGQWHADYVAPVRCRKALIDQ